MAHDLILAAASAAATAFFLLNVLPRLTNSGDKAKRSIEKANDDIEERSTTSSAGGGAAAYETQKAVDEYLMFHYGAPSDVMPYKSGPHNALDFMARCALLCERHCEALQDFTGERDETTAIDVGCAVGRGTFELARSFTHVLGIDYSSHFVEAAKAMQEQGELPYSYVEEGEIRRSAVASAPSDVVRSRMRFDVGDACALSASLAPVDCVLAANLLCRLPEPRAFLDRCRTLVKPGGVLVLVSPYSWLHAWTPKEKWLGGFVTDSADGQKPTYTRDTLIGYLTGGADAAAAAAAPFELVASGVEMPFLIREHARKFQWGCSEGLVFRRKTK